MISCIFDAGIAYQPPVLATIVNINLVLCGLYISGFDRWY